MDAILFWNDVCLAANKKDFSTEKPEMSPDPEQGGPTRTSRAFAIVHLAMYDAYVGIDGGDTYLTYTPAEKPVATSIGAARAAVAAAACQTLIALFPRQCDTFLKKHLEFVVTLGAGDPDVEEGLRWGRTVTARMLAERADDGWDASNNQYAPSVEPGRHRVDPVNPNQGFLGPLWGNVKPFGIKDLTTVIPGLPPPTLASQQYADAFNDVKVQGALSGGTRTQAETAKGLYWAYDGARNIGVPPRLYNQAVRAIVAQLGTVTEARNAKLFAMVNVAMADAGIQAWHEKYTYNFWRPVVGIRESETGWGPTGKGDGNAGTTGAPDWLPLGAPRTNQPGAPSFTPNFPAYPSGHATFGTAALHLVDKELALEPDFTFRLVSEELNGESVDRDGSIRPAFTAPMTIAEAIDDNRLSRVFLGVHWVFDCDEGVRNGKEIAERIRIEFPKLA